MAAEISRVPFEQDGQEIFPARAFTYGLDGQQKNAWAYITPVSRWKSFLSLAALHFKLSAIALVVVQAWLRFQVLLYESLQLFLHYAPFVSVSLLPSSGQSIKVFCCFLSISFFSLCVSNFILLKTVMRRESRSLHKTF